MIEQQYKRIGVDILTVNEIPGWVRHYCTTKINLLNKHVDKLLLWECIQGYFAIGNDAKKLHSVGYLSKTVNNLFIVVVPDTDIRHICLRFPSVVVPFQMLGCPIVCNNKPLFSNSKISLLAVTLKNYRNGK